MTERRRARPSLLLLALIGAALGCTPETPPPDRITLRAVSYADLTSWRDDDHAAALPAMDRSCAVLARLPRDTALGGGEARRPAAAWSGACAALAALPRGDPGAARRYFEQWFVPHRVANNDRSEGLFTGYFEPDLRGSRTRKERYTIPLYIRPPDLVTADLGEFRPNLAGERIAGRVVGGRLEPYPSRAEIERGALAGRGLELVWVDDAVDAFFLHIQGSGRIVLGDGTLVRAGYAGANGHAYTAVGRVLIERGALTAETTTMQSIKAWLRANPTEAAAVMAENASYVFFRELAEEGPLGALGVVLTPGRSLAVDRRFVPLGAPIWLDTSDPLAPDRPFRRLMVAQDTGGAIRGPVRGDVFWGHGDRAAERAGRMKQRGEYYLLLPRAAGS